MSKASKDIVDRGGGRKRGRNEEHENAIFCEKCVFVYQGEIEFKSHVCCQRKDADSVVEPTTKKSAISLDVRKGAHPKDQVRKKQIYCL